MCSHICKYLDVELEQGRRLEEDLAHLLALVRVTARAQDEAHHLRPVRCWAVRLGALF